MATFPTLYVRSLPPVVPQTSCISPWRNGSQSNFRHGWFGCGYHRRVTNAGRQDPWRHNKFKFCMFGCGRPVCTRERTSRCIPSSGHDALSGKSLTDYVVELRLPKVRGLSASAHRVSWRPRRGMWPLYRLYRHAAPTRQAVEVRRRNQHSAFR